MLRIFCHFAPIIVGENIDDSFPKFERKLRLSKKWIQVCRVLKLTESLLKNPKAEKNDLKEFSFDHLLG